MVPFAPLGQLIFVPEIDDVIITLLIITFEVLALHGPLLIVHLRVAVMPDVNVTADVGDKGAAIVAEPLTKDQAPVPAIGTFAAMVKAVLLQLKIVDPALALVGDK